MVTHSYRTSPVCLFHAHTHTHTDIVLYERPDLHLVRYLTGGRSYNEDDDDDDDDDHVPIMLLMRNSTGL